MGFIADHLRLHVFHLPTYSPDWNPDEQVWNYLKHQELQGHQARTKAELLNITNDKLTTMAMKVAATAAQFTLKGQQKTALRNPFRVHDWTGR